MFRSEDAGETWMHYQRGLIKEKQADELKKPHFSRIAIADDRTVFLGGFCGVFKSGDGGKTFDRLESHSMHIILGLDISPLTDDGFTIGLVTCGGGAYSTNDGGVSWEINNLGLPNSRLDGIIYSPNYAKDRTVFAATFGRVLKSTDAGGHWRTISAQSMKKYANQANPAKRGIRSKLASLFKRMSAQNGKKPTSKKTGTNPSGALSPVMFAISPGFSVDRTIFFAQHPNGIFRSLNGGETFELIWDTFDKRVGGFAISPEYPTDKTLFVSLWDGLYRSEDGGMNWEQVAHDLILGRASLAISPQYGLDRTLYAGSPSGLYRTRDGGETWKELPLGETDVGMAVSGLAISPDFATDRQLLVQIRGQELYLCRDYEKRFEAVPSEAANSGYEFSQIRGIPREIAPLIRFSPNYSQDKTVYAASAKKFLKSTDSGMTWSEIRRPLRYESETSLIDWLLSPISVEGNWRINHNKGFSASGAIHSSQSDSKVTLRFVGTGVRWIGTQGPFYGRANVWIDGVFREKISGYNKGWKSSVTLFSEMGLDYGTHTIMIGVDGTKDKKSKGHNIEIDAFDVIR